MRAVPPCSGGAPERAGLDRNATALEMSDRLSDRPGPDEAQVAVAGLDRLRRVQSLEAGPVDVQLPVPEPVVTEPVVLLIDLGAEDVAVERIRALPVGDGDYAVVDPEPKVYFATSTARLSRITITFTWPGYSS